ncbi:MAG: class I SAM-dependent methyltransferase [Acidobacteriia bacterium]|nr:class I SAM-dependent methyltransferase [Terriglobia bacterium]
MEAAAKGYKGIGMNGAMARWYARTGRGRYEQFKTWARRVAEEAPGSDVLEVAPGPGYCAIELAKLGWHRVTGLDISTTFVEIARRNAAEAGVKVDFQWGNASEMPFGDSSFDFVFCSAAFKNFSDPVGALREMYRVLKPGGQALIIDLRRDATVGEIDSEVDRMSQSNANRAFIKLTFRLLLLKRAYTKEAIERLVAQTPFRSAKIGLSGIGMEIGLNK